MATFRKVVCSSSGDGAPSCGHGVCLNNGTLCYCSAGFRYDSLVTEYRTCTMPTWVSTAFSASFLTVTLVALTFALVQTRGPQMLGTKNLHMLTAVALMTCGAYCIAAVASDLSPTALNWTFYLFMMVAHLCVLVPLFTRHIIPPAFQMIFMYPRWFDLALLAYYIVATVSLAYTWILCMIALSYGNIRLFNDGVTAWYAASAWLSVQLGLTIIFATRDLIHAVNHMTPKPFYRDLDGLYRRARSFQILAIAFSIPSATLLLVSVGLHFGSGGRFPNRFALTWALLMVLVLFDAAIVWFGWTGGMRIVLSQPRSSSVHEHETIELEPRFRGRTISFSKAIPVGGGSAPRISDLSSISQRRSPPDFDTHPQIATV